MKNIVILYDGSHCSDGFGGAWAAWKKFGHKAEYIGVLHHEPPPKGLENKEIYTIDFTYSEKIIRKLIKENKRVTAIDHHISAEKAAKLTKDYSYSPSHSGCALAWKYFHPRKPVPKLLKHVEDTDLWRFKLSRTKEIFAYLEMFDFNFKIWDKLVAAFEKPAFRKKFIERGGLLLKYENRLVEQLAKGNAELVRFSGYKTLAVNSPLFNSEIGYALIKKLPPLGIVWKKRADRCIYVSLRSNGKVNVAKIAEKFGGGGHKAAAAFTLPAGKKPPWRPLNPKS